MDTRTDAVVVRNERVIYRLLTDGEGVLLHLDSGQYHGLNRTGAALWELIDGRRTVADLRRLVRQRFEEYPDDVDDVVADFVSGLLARDLLRVADVAR